MEKKCKYFPITAFSIIMGLSGLTIAFGKFYHMQWMPKILHDISLFFTLGLFFLFIVVYGRKAIKYVEEVIVDFNHRIRINFFSAISISFLLLSIAFMAYWPFVSLLFWWVGVILHTYLMFYTISFWIQRNIDIKYMNPAWFIPVVGNMLVPIAGIEYMPKAFSFFFFASGFFFWIVLFVIFMNRVVFHHQLPQKFLPTLFILIAPPAIGFIAYIRITQSWDSFAIFLLYMSYFFVLLIMFLYKSFHKLKFFISWWAFTFPLMAVTISSIVAFQISNQEVYKYLSFIFFAIAILFMVFVIWKTAEKVRKGEICVKED